MGNQVTWPIGSPERIASVQNQFAAKYGVRWMHYWDLALPDGDMEAKYLRALGVGSAEMAEMAHPGEDDRHVTEWEWSDWYGLLGGFSLRALGDCDRARLIQIARALGLYGQAVELRLCR